MFVPELTEPKRKKARRRGGAGAPVLQQPLPVPVASLTDVKPDNAVWRWYRGRMAPEDSGVTVEAAEEADAVARMGFFGERASVRERTLVKEEEFDPRPARVQEGPEPVQGAGCWGEGSDEDLEKEGVGVEAGSSGSPKEDPASPPPETDKPKSWREWSKAKKCVDPLFLDPAEAFFLGYALGCLVVEDEDGEELDLDQTWSRFCRRDRRFPWLYAAYHHFRSKGWVPRDGTKFGSDLLLYKHGPPFYHASYSVVVQAAGDDDGLPWRSLSGLNRITEAAAKELMLARVDLGRKRGRTLADLREDPRLLKKTSVIETLVRRWVPSQEREEG